MMKKSELIIKIEVNYKNIRKYYFILKNLVLLETNFFF